MLFWICWTLYTLNHLWITFEIIICGPLWNLGVLCITWDIFWFLWCFFSKKIKGKIRKKGKKEKKGAKASKVEPKEIPAFLMWPLQDWVTVRVVCQVTWTSEFQAHHDVGWGNWRPIAFQQPCTLDPVYFAESHLHVSQFSSDLGGTQSLLTPV